MRDAHPDFDEGFWQDMNSVAGLIDARTIRYQTRLKNTVSSSTKVDRPIYSCNHRGAGSDILCWPGNHAVYAHHFRVIFAVISTDRRFTPLMQRILESAYPLADTQNLEFSDVLRRNPSFSIYFLTSAYGRYC